MSTRHECESALALYEAAILEFKNVVAVAIVPTHDTGAPRGGVGGPANDSAPASEDWCVGVYVSRKVPFPELEEEDLIPSYLQVIDPVKGVFKVPTRVIEREKP
jgi:hypothetical protein